MPVRWLKYILDEDIFSHGPRKALGQSCSTFISIGNNWVLFLAGNKNDPSLPQNLQSLCANCSNICQFSFLRRQPGLGLSF